MNTTTGIRAVGSGVALLLVGGLTAAAIPNALTGKSSSTHALPPGTTTVLIESPIDTEVEGWGGNNGTIRVNKTWSLNEPQLSVIGPDAHGVTRLTSPCKATPGPIPNCHVRFVLKVPATTNIVHKTPPAQGMHQITVWGMQGRLDVEGPASLNVSSSSPRGMAIKTTYTVFGKRLTQPPGAVWSVSASGSIVEFTDLARYALRTPGALDPQRTLIRQGLPGELQFRGIPYEEIRLRQSGDKYDCEFNGDGLRTMCNNVVLGQPLPTPWDGLPPSLPRVQPTPAAAAPAAPTSATTP